MAQGTGRGQQVAKHRARKPDAAESGVETSAPDSILHGQIAVLAQIPTHIRRIDENTHTSSIEHSRRTDARELQELGGMDGAGTEDDFAPSCNRPFSGPVSDANATDAPAVEFNP